MDRNDVVRAWGHILTGKRPFMSIEITRECPLRCPGCYAYDPQHLGGAITLRELSDFKGDALVKGILAVVDEHQPMHVSLVGGDPLVRYRELEQVLPELERRGIHTQLVTSAFRAIPESWAKLPHLSVVVSIDGLQPEHDVRRAPATYDRILKNIAGRRVTVHCTVTGQMMDRESYLDEFLAFWTPRPEVRKVWFSLFTPQQGDSAREILTPAQRQAVVRQLLALRPEYPKLDMVEEMIREFARPPAAPAECIFARTTTTISADLKSRITPCQFGGTPDCAQCGCVASMGLAALGHKQAAPGISVGAVLRLSQTIGDNVKRTALRYRTAKCQLRSMLLPARSRFWPRPKSRSLAD